MMWKMQNIFCFKWLSVDVPQGSQQYLERNLRLAHTHSQSKCAEVFTDVAEKNYIC